MPGALANRPLFLLVAMGSLLCCVRIGRTPDTEAKQSQVCLAANPAPGVERQENRLVLRLMIATC